jgi:hypothetical protein
MATVMTLDGMRRGKRSACRFHKIGSTYHAGGGPIGFFRIEKSRKGWVVRKFGGASGRLPSKRFASLKAAKAEVCWRIKG